MDQHKAARRGAVMLPRFSSLSALSLIFSEIINLHLCQHIKRPIFVFNHWNYQGGRLQYYLYYIITCLWSALWYCCITKHFKRYSEDCLNWNGFENVVKKWMAMSQFTCIWSPWPQEIPGDNTNCTVSNGGFSTVRGSDTKLQIIAVLWKLNGPQTPSTHAFRALVDDK